VANPEKSVLTLWFLGSEWCRRYDDCDESLFEGLL
jgi:hypothetical protein